MGEIDIEILRKFNEQGEFLEKMEDQLQNFNRMMLGTEMGFLPLIAAQLATFNVSKMDMDSKERMVFESITNKSRKYLGLLFDRAIKEYEERETKWCSLLHTGLLI